MLESHTNAIEKVLLAQSKAARNAGHPNLRGGPREWFIRQFLENHLPTNLEIGQGEIIDENTRPSPLPKNYRNQVDIAVYRRDLPKIQYSKDNNAYFAEGVIATIESKSKLTKSELKKACIASNNHKNLDRNKPLHSFGPISEQILTYVVAYDGPQRIGTVANWINEINEELNLQIANQLDMIIVLGKGGIWKINKFPAIPIADVPNGHHWASAQQSEGNLYLLFTHFLSWCSFIASPPNTTGYASNLFFQEYNTF